MGPSQFILPGSDRLAKTREKLEAAGGGIVAYAVGMRVALLVVTMETVEVVPYHR